MANNPPICYPSPVQARQQTTRLSTFTRGLCQAAAAKPAIKLCGVNYNGFIKASQASSSATKRERPLCDPKGQSPPTVNLAREIHSRTREFHRRLIQHQHKQELGKQQQPVFTSHQRLLSLQQKKKTTSPAPDKSSIHQHQKTSIYATSTSSTAPGTRDDQDQQQWKKKRRKSIRSRETTGQQQQSAEDDVSKRRRIQSSSLLR